MSDIYVFGPKETDFTTMGLACALTPTQCIFREQANGESSLEMTHPLDSFGRYTALQQNNILVVPVPVRTTPEIQNGKVVTTVYSYKIKPSAQFSDVKQRTLYTAAEGGNSIKILPGGERVTVVGKYLDDKDEIDENARWKVKTRYGTGWVNYFALEEEVKHEIEDNSQSIEEVQPAWTVAPQIFRIYEVEKSLTEIKVSARHITYDLLYYLTRRIVSSIPQTTQTVLDWILYYIFKRPNEPAIPFHAYTNVENTYSGIKYIGRNPIDCFLNEEDGVCKLFNVSLVRDNYDLYFLHDPGLNRGVRIQYGKNMTGVTFTSNEENLATRIVPLGSKPMDRNNNGTTLFLTDDVNTAFIDSPNIDKYPVIHTYCLECENCEVGQEEESGGVITVKVARARMLAQAQKLFTEDHVDEPEISMKVEFLNLGDTEEYKQFKNLENLYLYDYVIVQHPDLGIDETARIVEIEWDCLLDQMKSVEIGQVGKSLANTGVTSWQIPSGISGSKIASDSIESATLKDNVIAARHIQTTTLNSKTVVAQEISALLLDTITAHIQTLDSESITTDEFYAELANIATAQITTANIEKANIDWVKAGVVDALTAYIKSLDAETITTDELYAELAKAAVAQITTANIQNANIDWAKINNLYIGILDTVRMNAEYGDFDFATVQKLVADAMVLEKGTAGTIGIENLLVTSANMLNATIGELVLKGDDGKYYVVNIDSSGSISATERSISAAEIIAGQTSTGKQIVETNMNIRDLNTTTLTAQTAAISEIVTKSLAADKITAGQALISSATIPALYTTSIQAIGEDLDLSANKSINLTVGKAIDDLRIGSRNYMRHSKNLYWPEHYGVIPRNIQTALADLCVCDLVTVA